MKKIRQAFWRIFLYIEFCENFGKIAINKYENFGIFQGINFEDFGKSRIFAFSKSNRYGRKGFQTQVV